jgi:protein disulfide-isomerase
MLKAATCLIMFVLTLTLQLESAESSNRITWLTSYDAGVAASKASSKPLLILFTGSDWCTWCIKLEEEVLNTEGFVETARDKFVFLKLDFPLNTTLPSDVVAQNKALQKKFDVTGFPTIIILNSQQQQIGTTGYRPGGGKQYALHLLKIVDDHLTYTQKVQNLHNQPLAGTELKHLYEHAVECRCDADAKQICLLGAESDQKTFFLLEQYRQMAEEGALHSRQALDIRNQLIASDPHNVKMTYYQVAIIDFEASCKEGRAASTPETAISSLVEYIDKFGDKDKENVWRLEMLISQVYFDQNYLSEALRYAQASYQAAPLGVQPEIGMAIKSIQLLMH